jgi:4-hydroxybenzoate polyprenyltransferase
MNLNINIVKPYLHLMRIDRPIGTLLLLWPTLIALWLASNGSPSFAKVIIFVSGVCIMRAAGCIINDLADRDFDRYVARTKNRPLAINAISVRAACILFGLLLTLAFFLVLHLSNKTLILSLVALALALIYPFAKRFTDYPQFVLGMAFAWSIPMVYIEVSGQIGLEACLLYLSILAWVIAYDTQYAMVDKEDDIKIGIKSTAITFGSYDRYIIFSLQVLTLVGLCAIGIATHLRWCYFVGLGIALGLTIYQQSLIKERVPKRCMQAFLNNNYFGAVIFLGLMFN